MHAGDLKGVTYTVLAPGGLKCREEQTTGSGGEETETKVFSYFWG